MGEGQECPCEDPKDYKRAATIFEVFPFLVVAGRTVAETDIDGEKIDRKIIDSNGWEIFDETKGIKKIVVKVRFIPQEKIDVTGWRRYIFYGIDEHCRFTPGYMPSKGYPAIPNPEDPVRWPTYPEGSVPKDFVPGWWDDYTAESSWRTLSTMLDCCEENNDVRAWHLPIMREPPRDFPDDK